MVNLAPILSSISSKLRLFYLQPRLRLVRRPHRIRRRSLPVSIFDGMEPLAIAYVVRSMVTFSLTGVLGSCRNIGTGRASDPTEVVTGVDACGIFRIHFSVLIKLSWISPQTSCCSNNASFAQVSEYFGAGVDI